MNSWILIAILIGFIIFLPISEVFIQLFNTSESWSHLQKTVFSTYLINTIILTIGTGLLSTLIGVFCAWVVGCCEFPLKKFFEWALILPLAIPTYVSAYAYFDILELSNPILIWVRENINLEAMQSLNSFFVYFFTILVLSSVLYPYIYLLTRASFLKQGNQLVESGLSLGHNINEIFWKITLPMARPAVFAGLSLVIMETLNDYGAVKHFGIPTFTSGIFRTWLGMGDMSGALKLAAYLMLLILILLLIEKKARSRARYHENSSSNKPFKKIILSRKKSINILVPGVSFNYELLPNINTIIGFHKGFSPPGPGSNQSDNVKPEESLNTEFGASISSGLNSFKTIFFINDYKNLLGSDTQFAGLGTYDQFNAGKVYIRGLELSFTNKILIKEFIIPFQLSYTLTTTEFKSSFESDYESWGTVEEGFELPYLPKHQLFIESGLSYSKLDFNIRLKNSSRMRTIAGKGDLDKNFSTDEIRLIDFFGLYKINNSLNFFFSLSNLTDTKSVVSRRPAGLRSSLPRSINFGIRFDS